jgi:hypothetical protein
MPKIKRFSTFLTLCLVFLSLSSCKVYYATADIDAQLKSSFEPMYANTQTFTKQLTDLRGQLAGLNCSDTQEPFQSAVYLMNQVDALKAVLIQLEQKVNTEYLQFKQYTQGKTQITSGTEEWKQLKQTKKNLKNLAGQIEDKNKEAVAKATELNTYLNEKIVPVVQFCDVNMYSAKFKQAMDTLGKMRGYLDGNFRRYEMQVANIVRKFNATQTEKCTQLNNDMLAMIAEREQLVNIAKSMKAAGDQFKGSTTGKLKIYSCSPDWEVVLQAEKDMMARQKELMEMQLRIQTLVNRMQSVINTMGE